MKTRNEKKWPSDSATWKEALAAVGDVRPSGEKCQQGWCQDDARAVIVNEDLRFPDLYVCPSHAEIADDEGERISSIWTGGEWDAWENVLDFPEGVKRS